jgi:hypothetical protein
LDLALALDSGLELSWIWRRDEKEWRYSHTRVDYEGTWQREVITSHLKYKYLVLASVMCGSSLLRHFYIWIFKGYPKAYKLTDGINAI